MAGTEEKIWMRWNGEFGWNSIFGGIAAFAIIVTASLSLASWRISADNSTAAVAELRNIVSEIQKANAAFGERITKVEVQVDTVSKAVDRVERKLDALGTVRR